MNRGCVFSSTALWTWKATWPFYPPLALSFDSTLTHACERAHTHAHTHTKSIYTSNIPVRFPSSAPIKKNWQKWHPICLIGCTFLPLSSVELWRVHFTRCRTLASCFRVLYWLLVQLSFVHNHSWFGSCLDQKIIKEEKLLRASFFNFSLLQRHDDDLILNAISSNEIWLGLDLVSINFTRRCGNILKVWVHKFGT